MKKISKIDTRIYRTAYTPVALVAGLPVLLAGAYLAAAGFGFLPLPGSGRGSAPQWLIGVVGLTFVLTGGLLVRNVVSGAIFRRRMEAIRRRHPDHPWLADYPWDPYGIGDESANRWARSLIAVILLGVFLVPFNWWAFFTRDPGRMVKGITIFFDAIWLLTAGAFCYRFLQFSKFGKSRLSFAFFPFAPGERIRVAFSPNRFNRLGVTLRYVEERFEADGIGRNRSAHHRSYEHYSEKKTIDVPEYSRKVLMAFDIPNNPDWTTRMTPDPTIRYWELVVASDIPGIDFRTTFPLPVYANPVARLNNPQFSTPVEPHRDRSRYGFELGLALFVAALIAIPMLIRPTIHRTALDWAQATWHRTMASRTLIPLPGIDGSVMDLAVASDGSVWVLSKYAVNRFEPNGSDYRKTTVIDGAIYRQRFGRSLDSLSSILPLGPDEVVVGGWYGQLLHYRAGRWEEPLPRDNNPIKRRIFTFSANSKSIYIGAQNGVWRWSKGSGPKPVSDLPIDETAAMIAFGDGLLSGIGSEIWQFRNKEWRRGPALPSSLGRITALCRTRDGLLWIGAYGGGAVLDANGMVLGRALEGIQISSILENDGRIWASTWRRGVVTRRKEGWGVAGVKQGLSGENLTDIAIDRAGNLWLAVYGMGVSRIRAADLEKTMIRFPVE